MIMKECSKCKKEKSSARQNKKAVQLYQKEYRAKNKTKAKEYHRQWYHRHTKRRLELSLVSRIRQSVKKKVKIRTKDRLWEKMVGFTFKEFLKHIESLFQSGMTWDNYGEWEIDHVIPVADFDCSTVNDLDFKRCWALSNLRPLWAKDNRVKNSNAA